jgi:geranylgeranyl diphosphate synthase type II
MANQYDSVKARLVAFQASINRRLAELAPSGPPSEEFNRAIRYSLLAPGKRLRPILTLITATSLGANDRDAMDPACALEMIHTASLIIDDLPAMDNASCRRGKEANHRVFGEDKTMLAGFALVNQAFDVISRVDSLTADTRLALIRSATEAIGLNGIIAGQERDLGGIGSDATPESIRQIHSLKTGALFIAAAEMGARIGGVEGAKLKAFRSFGHFLGLAYQTRDDLIDEHMTPESAGKDVRADADKATLVKILGQRDALQLSKSFVDSAIQSLNRNNSATADLSMMTRMIFKDEMIVRH